MDACAISVDGLLPGNLFKTRITCSERITYRIEYSDDFQTWTALMTNSAMQLDITNGCRYRSTGAFTGQKEFPENGPRPAFAEPKRK